MTEEKLHEPMPVQGYTTQSDKNIADVNINKLLEERVLRRIEQFQAPRDKEFGGVYDQRSLALAKTHAQEAFMWLNRAIFNPERIGLPEDNDADPIGTYLQEDAFNKMKADAPENVGRTPFSPPDQGTT